jgi:hypothetical protein
MGSSWGAICKGWFCGILQSLQRLERVSARGAIAKMRAFAGFMAQTPKDIFKPPRHLGGMKDNHPTLCALSAFTLKSAAR